MVEFFVVLTVISMLVPIYVYLVYPALLFILVKLGRGQVNKRDDNYLPSVTLMVSCYNEVEVVREKISNCIALDYPSELIVIIFISDGSDDGTDEIIKEYENQNIKLIRQEGRLGKTSAINLAMPSATGEVIVFSDANAMYQKDAIRKLVRNFVDREVGYVVGAALYTDGKDNAAATSEDTYWRYEIALKEMESKLHSVVGGDGAIYAIRKDLFIPLDAKDINDFVNPLQIIAQGFRGVFDAEAICLEETAGDFAKEARRKERIVNRSFRGLMKVKQVLNPFKFGFFSFEIISHKLLRWLIPVFLLGTVLGSIYLSFHGVVIFKALLMGEVVFFWLSILGYLKSAQTKISPIFFYPYYFLMVNWYSLIGTIKALMGDIQVIWSSPRGKREHDKVNPMIERGVVFLLFVSTASLLVTVLT